MDPAQRGQITHLNLNNTGLMITDISQLSEYRALQSLSIAGVGLQQLQGVEQLSSLQHLDVADNKLNNLAELAGVMQLQTLDVANNQLSSLMEINHFNQLQKLNLSGNSGLLFTEIDSVIRNNSGLKEIGLSDINIGDFPIYTQNEPPHETYALTTLALDNTGSTLINLQTLSAYKHLTSLSFSGNELEDVTGVMNFSELSKLDVSDNKLINIYELSQQRGLTELNLAGNSGIMGHEVDMTITANENLKVLDVSGVKINVFNSEYRDSFGAYYGFEELYLDDTGLIDPDLMFLANYNELKRLSLKDNKIRSLSGYPYLDQLEYFNVSGNPLDDITLLMTTTNLVSLDLSDISDVQFPDVEMIIRNNPNLTAINLEGVALDFIPVDTAQREKIKSLNVSNTGLRLTDFHEISMYTSLEVLSVIDCGLVRLTGIEQLPNLQQLNVSNNKLRNLDELSILANINSLYAGGNQLENLFGINGFTQLSKLYLSGNAALSSAEVDMVIRNNESLTEIGVSDIEMRNFPIYVQAEPPYQTYALRILELDNTGADHPRINRLSAYTELRSLSFANNVLEDVMGVINMPDLEVLDISNNQMTSLYELSQIQNLQSLNVSGNSMLAFPEVDMTIQANPKLSELRLADIPVVNFNGYNNEFTELDLSGTGFNNISELLDYTSLEVLSLKANDVMMVDELQSMNTLEYLNLLENSNLDCSSIEYLQSMLVQLEVEKPVHCSLM